MTALPNAIRKGLTFFAILGAATFLVAACGGGGGGGGPIKPPPIKPPPGPVMKIVPNGAPTTKGSIPDRTLGVGGRAVIDLSGYFADPDGDSLTYRLTYRPSRNSANVRASVSGNSLLIRGVASPGVTVRVTARDPGGLSAYQDIDVSVKALVENRAPTARGSIPDRTLEVGERYTIDLSNYFTDPDGDRLTYQLTFSSGHDGNVHASVSGDELQIQGVASPGARVRVTASDPSGRTAYQDFTVSVSAVGSGQPPNDPLDDVNVQISSSCPRQVQICVRDNSCEDGDRISVSVNGAQLFSGELFNAPHCFNAPVREGANAVSVLALNGTGYKGACDHINANTGEIRINGQAQGWRHPARAGSRANINVTIGPAGGSCSPGSGTGGDPRMRSQRFVAMAWGSRETGRSFEWAWATGTGDSASAAKRDASNRCAATLSASCRLVSEGTTRCVALAESECTGNCQNPAVGIDYGNTRVASQNAAVAACRSVSPSSAVARTCAVPTGRGGLADICGSDGR